MFTAVEFAIVQHMQTGDTVLADTLLSLGLPVDQKHDVYQVSMLLRRAMVSEWLENTNVYQGFVTTDIRAAAHEFLSTQQFSGDLGDLMVLALSNVLHTPICIFTSVVNMPVLSITPNVLPVTSVQPLFLKMDQGIMIVHFKPVMNRLSLKNKQSIHVEEKLVSMEKHPPQADVLARVVGHNVLPFVVAKILIATMDMVLDQHHLQQEGGRPMIPKDSHCVGHLPRVL